MSQFKNVTRLCDAENEQISFTMKYGADFRDDIINIFFFIVFPGADRSARNGLRNFLWQFLLRYKVERNYLLIAKLSEAAVRGRKEGRKTSFLYLVVVVFFFVLNNENSFNLLWRKLQIQWFSLSSSSKLEKVEDFIKIMGIVERILLFQP